MFDFDDEAFQAFLEESREHLGTIERELLVLEQNGPEAATVNAIFRAAHSIKGTAGFFALGPVKDLAHAMESVLGRIRAAELSATPEVISALLEANSRLAEMIADVREVERVDASAVLAQLQSWAGDGPMTFSVNPLSLAPQTPRRSGSETEVTRPDGSMAFVIDGDRLAEAQRSELGGRWVHWVEVEDDVISELEKLSVILDRNPRDGTRIEAACSSALDRDRLASMLGIAPEQVHTAREILLALDAPILGVVSPEVAPVLHEQGTRTTFSYRPTVAIEPQTLAVKSEGAGSIRVAVTQLDRLMALAGELVLTRNALLKKASERDLDEMIDLTQRVDAITSELQDGIMATRMQPVGIVFTKFRRIVRDLALSLQKQLELEIEGEEVELDKTIIEAIGDPLAHLVRNAADHGIEDPATRTAAGKSDRGHLRLRAFHQAGQVVIEVSDDGRGIDPVKVANKAVENGMLSREQVESMSEEEIVRLIFEPGLSTAAKVTDVSGRGVGMDVVQSSIAKVGGAVDVRSALGSGTTITVRLPLTLAIIPSILVATGGERFAIPQVNLFELVRIQASEVDRRIERVGSAAVIRLRDELLPLVRLSDVLKIPAPEETKKTAVNVVVVASGPLRFGLVVDQLLDSEEIVVKPLGAHLSAAREYAGATILGDGSVALILDVAGIAATENLASTKSMLEALAARNADEERGEMQSFLVVENGPGELFAVPLALVSRIERLAESSVVTVGGRRSVSHGTNILALVALEDAAKVTPRAQSLVVHAVVCRVFGREVGVIASRIVDVVETTAAVDGVTHVQPGVLGSLIVEGRLVLLCDVHGLVGAVLPEIRTATAPNPSRPMVLVVEDSPFFRKQLVSVLQEGGYQTLAAEDGRQGLEELTAHADDVQLIITDIEMPRMDGLEMTRKIREETRFSKLPIFAVTSLSSESDQKRGREAGLNEWLIKFDREQIIERAQAHLASARKTKQGGRALQQGALG